MKRNKKIQNKIMKDIILAEKLRKSFHFTTMSKKRRTRKKNKAILKKLYIEENWYKFGVANYLYILIQNSMKINHKINFYDLEQPIEEADISIILKDLPKPAKLNYEFEKRKMEMKMNEESL